jgi:hypothetical protein
MHSAGSPDGRDRRFCAMIPIGAKQTFGTVAQPPCNAKFSSGLKGQARRSPPVRRTIRAAQLDETGREEACHEVLAARLSAQGELSGRGGDQPSDYLDDLLRDGGLTEDWAVAERHWQPVLVVPCGVGHGPFREC